MTHILSTQSDLDHAIGALIAADGRFGAMFEATGSPALRRRETGFAGLSAIIVSQQLSTQSAAAIWGRLAAAFDPFEPESVRKSRADRLGRLGLSAAKIKTLKIIARAVAAGDIDLEALAQHDADDCARIAHRAARHRAMDRRHLSSVLPGPRRRLAGGRPRAAGSDSHGLRAAQPPDRQGHGQAERGLAAVAGAAAHLLWAYYKVAKTPGFNALPASPPATLRKKTARR